MVTEFGVWMPPVAAEGGIHGDLGKAGSSRSSVMQWGSGRWDCTRAWDFGGGFRRRREQDLRSSFSVAGVSGGTSGRAISDLD
jgi:hypothetical protein